MSRSDEKFVQDAKALFDESVDKLDAATLSKLNQGRHRALDELQSTRGAWLRWAPAAGIAAAVVLAVMVTLPRPDAVDVIPTNVTDMEILLGEDSIEMFEELEFYTFIDMLETENDVG